ncbi:hypothetical protein [Kitasatospora sp. NBC_00458]|uniref:hypothetical protein n=1 Tax=Kitasatospora sp. NBC_00458 TaxID=2903568 RepID=UPI002E16DFCF
MTPVPAKAAPPACRGVSTADGTIPPPDAALTVRIRVDGAGGDTGGILPDHDGTASTGGGPALGSAAGRER